ncbi:MAG: S1 RNA-binding domain-containing protein [Chloroflexota bacterium]|nr:S1 RNA-binding domain-containing protein [Chloroflexota bacterium]
MSEELTPTPTAVEATETTVAEAIAEAPVDVAAPESVVEAANEVPVVEAPVEMVEAVASEAAVVEAVAAEAPAEPEAAAPEAEPVAAAAEAEAPVAEAEAPAAVSDEQAVVTSNAATPRSIDELAVGMEIVGKVKRIELYGAFVDIGVGKDGLLHISQLGKPDVRNVEDVVKAGETLTVYVMKIDKEQGRIALSVSKPLGMPWEALRIGLEVTGTVIKLEAFGAFVDFGAERPGMVHVSELANGYVKSPEDVVKVGDSVTAQIIKLDRKKKRIDLSVKALTEREEKAAAKAVREEQMQDEKLPTAMELALRRAMQGEDIGYTPGSGRKGRDYFERGERRARKQEMEREELFERTIKGHRG